MKELQEDTIPFNAKIFSIIEVFDATTPRRPYKEPFDLNKTMKIPRQGSGRHFHPELCRIFDEMDYSLNHQIAHTQDIVWESVLSSLIAKHLLNGQS